MTEKQQRSVEITRHCVAALGGRIDKETPLDEGVHRMHIWVPDWDALMTMIRTAGIKWESN